MSFYVLGYGSLVGAVGVNGRGMTKQYKPKDLTETYLNDYERHLEAGMRGGVNYYGISPKKGSRVNGVVFKIKRKDVRPFLGSEGFGFPEGVRPYKMVDVTDKVDLKVDGRIWACVSNHRFVTEVAPGYFHRVAEALKERSPKFCAEFAPFDKDWKRKERTAWERFMFSEGAW